MVIISNLYALTKVLPILDMNAGTVQCKCGVLYTARDPTPCAETAQHVAVPGHSPVVLVFLYLPLSGTSGKTRRLRLELVSEESSFPATEGLGSLQDVNVKSDSTESTGNSKSVSSGEDILLASHSGGDARITNLETGLSSLQTSLNNLSSLLTSRLGPSLGTKTPQTSLPLSTPPVGGVPVSGVVYTRSACDPSFCVVTISILLPTGLLFSS